MPSEQDFTIVTHHCGGSVMEASTDAQYVFHL